MEDGWAALIGYIEQLCRSTAADPQMHLVLERRRPDSLVIAGIRRHADGVLATLLDRAQQQGTVRREIVLTDLLRLSRRGARGPQRLADDRHVWATTLFDEVVGLGYGGSYPSVTPALRVRRLRPLCPVCIAGSHRELTIIEHPPGEETQFDRPELPSRRRSGARRGLGRGAMSRSSVAIKAAPPLVLT